MKKVCCGMKNVSIYGKFSTSALPLASSCQNNPSEPPDGIDDDRRLPLGSPVSLTTLATVVVSAWNAATRNQARTLQDRIRHRCGWDGSGLSRSRYASRARGCRQGSLAGLVQGSRAAPPLRAGG